MTPAALTLAPVPEALRWLYAWGDQLWPAEAPEDDVPRPAKARACAVWQAAHRLDHGPLVLRGAAR